MQVLETPSGNENFQDWYQQFRPTFYSIGARYGYEKQEVSDVIQQLFLELIEKNIDSHSITNPKYYLTVAFKRKLIDRYREKGNHQLVDYSERSELAGESNAQDEIEHFEHNQEVIQRLHRAFEKLPKRYQRVIRLKFYEGRSIDEIAGLTGLSKRTIYNSLFEGVKILRTEMYPVGKFSIRTLFLFLALILIFFIETR